jgi:hypothetical protein
MRHCCRLQHRVNKYNKKLAAWKADFAAYTERVKLIECTHPKIQ